MNIQKPISIIGMGKCLPANKVCSHELEEKLHIPKGWAERYSGVKERGRNQWLSRRPCFGRGVE